MSIHKVNRRFVLRGAAAVCNRLCHMVRVAVQPETGHLGIDIRASRLRDLVLFQHQYAGTVAEHEAVTILVPGPARMRGVVVACRQCARCSESIHTQR